MATGDQEGGACTLDADHEESVQELDRISSLANAACKEATDLRLFTWRHPVPGYQQGVAEICFTGATNVGKSSLANAVLCSDSAGPFFKTHVEAETTRCTVFKFGPDGRFSLDGQPKADFGDLFGALETLQWRRRDVEDEQAEKGQGEKGEQGEPEDGDSQSPGPDIVVEAPQPPMFQTGDGLAWIVDTPGITESEGMKDAVLQRLRPQATGHEAVLVHCVSLCSGISTKPGAAPSLSWVDKILVESCVPAHRVVLVATHFDQFADQQQASQPTGVAAKAASSYASLMGRATKLTDEQKMAMAHEAFQSWATKVRSSYPGIVVLPFARIDFGRTVAPWQLGMVRDIRLALVDAVRRCHKDVALAHHQQLCRQVTERIRDIEFGSHELSEQHQKVVDKAVAASDEALAEGSEKVEALLRKAAEEVKAAGGPYARYQTFYNDLVKTAYDNVAQTVKESKAAALARACCVVRAELRRTLQSAETDGPAESTGVRVDSDLEVASAVGGLGAGFIGGMVALGSAESAAAGLALRFAVGAALGSAAAAVVTVASVGFAVHALQWTYEDAVQAVHRHFAHDLTDSNSCFKQKLRDNVRQLVMEAVTQVNEGSKSSAKKLSELSLRLKGVSLLRRLSAHVVHSCLICLERSAVVQLEPCSHMAFCSQCATEASVKFKHCPLCRRLVERSVLLFK